MPVAAALVNTGGFLPGLPFAILMLLSAFTILRRKDLGALKRKLFLGSLRRKFGRKSGQKNTTAVMMVIAAVALFLLLISFTNLLLALLALMVVACIYVLVAK